MFVVHIKDNGINVNTNISFFLQGEMKNSAAPIKK